MDINNIGTNMIKLNKEAIKNAMESGTKNKTMQGENFRLGEGVLECDNFYIELRLWPDCPYGGAKEHLGSCAWDRCGCAKRDRGQGERFRIAMCSERWGTMATR